MSGWFFWSIAAVLSWLLISLVLGVGIGRFIRVSSSALSSEGAVFDPHPDERRGARALPTADRPRVLVVDDDPSLRTLLRTTVAESEFDLREAESAEHASRVVELWRPSVVVLDVGLPGLDGLSFCRRLKEQSGDGAPAVVLLTGAELSSTTARVAGADAMLRKPFSPLELVALLGRFVGQHPAPRSRLREATPQDLRPEEQLNLYARDLGELLARERASRTKLEEAYNQTIESLARALEWKDAGTGGHALRVQRYALQLAAAVDPALLDDPSVEPGFLLHDVGKIAIPDSILRKRGPLTPSEQRVVARHPIIGSELLMGIPLLEGEGVGVVRSHHERWDGAGYPDGLGGEQIPSAARIFAVADALDAMTSDRPYRNAIPWDVAAEELAAQRERHFDPTVVDAFEARAPLLERLHEEFTAQVA
jgi:response regulator RpfG family c-di-GMP phosphodiesterase